MKQYANDTETVINGPMWEKQVYFMFSVNRYFQKILGTDISEQTCALFLKNLKVSPSHSCGLCRKKLSKVRNDDLVRVA